MSGPDDISLILISVFCYSAYYGNDLWAVEYDFFGFGKCRLSHYITFSVGVLANW